MCGISRSLEDFIDLRRIGSILIRVTDKCVMEGFMYGKS